jgi:hypothetical protein
LYDLKTASLLKNRILQVAIEVVRAFDGYPHRLMGDALMAFFGDQKISDEQASINAINCSVVLRYVIKNYIIPKLETLAGTTDTKLGIRVGVDYGKNEDIVWGAFGYTSAFEITAHGISIDLCSKLQNMAGKNGIMLGQGILNFIDYPTKLSSFKEDSDGHRILYVKPNLTKKDGSSINYRCRLLDHYYFSLLPLPLEEKQDEGSHVESLDGVLCICEYQDNDGGWYPYESVSKPLRKFINIRFRLLVDSKFFSRQTVRFDAYFKKTNHGFEARNDKDIGEYSPRRVTIDHSSKTIIHRGIFYKENILPERTKYRGLHEMKVVGQYNINSMPGCYKNIFGIFIL